MTFMRRLALAVAGIALALGGLVAAPAQAEEPPLINDWDLYTTHMDAPREVNGRQWWTTCEQYSTAVERCTTNIWGTVVLRQDTGGQVGYVKKNDWVFNNLTYKPAKRSHWTGNPLATPGIHTINGKQWRTECDTPRTGNNGCRSYIRGYYATEANGVYSMVTRWQFNNMIRFTDAAPAGTSYFAEWVNIDLTIRSEADLANPKLTALPTAFQAKIAQLALSGSCSEVPFSQPVTVVAYHGAGYAYIKDPSCNVIPSQVMYPTNGAWELFGNLAWSGAFTSCRDLEAADVPRGSGRLVCAPGMAWNANSPTIPW